MRHRLSIILLTLLGILLFQPSALANNNEDNKKPVILYNSSPKKYEIADIKVTGVDNYEDYVLIGISGLTVGQTITVPGDDITAAIKRYWRHGLFSDVRISADKIEDGKIYLLIELKQRPRIKELIFHGVKKSEREDLEEKLGLVKGSQITPNLINRSKILIKRHFDDKGYKNAEVEIVERESPEHDDQVNVENNRRRYRANWRSFACQLHIFRRCH